MAGITAQQFVNTVGETLRRGQSESVAGVYNDWLVGLLPIAMTAFAWKVAQDAAKRGLLTTKLEIPLYADGTGEISENESRQILKNCFQFATCEDLSRQDENGDNRKLIYKPNHQDVMDRQRYLDPQFAYFGLRSNTIITRPTGDEAAVAGPLWLYVNYIPDFSAFPLPYELVGEAMEEMIALALPGLAKK